MVTAPFKSEADLCAAFIGALPKEWTAYPETAGFDILLSRNEDGFQIGVEAKLKLNAVVLSQALEDYGWQWREAGPDCRAVLVPYGAAVAGISGIVPHLALTVISMRSYELGCYGPAFSPYLPSINDRYSCYEEGWHELCPTERCILPEYVPDVTAGASAPVQLTRWKIAAIKIAIILERRGYVTRADFRAIRIDPRRWIDGAWLLPGRQGFTVGPSCPAFKAQHPTVYAQIEADAEKWMPVSLMSQADLNLGGGV